MAAADVYRPAAIKQLEILGKSIDVTVFSMGTDTDPAEIARQAVEKAKSEGYDTVVVDTAGRQVVDKELMEELRRVKKTGEFIFCTVAYYAQGIRTGANAGIGSCRVHKVALESAS